MEYDPLEDDTTPLTPQELKDFGALLEEKRNLLLRAVSGAAQEEDVERADELDLARAEYEAAFGNRLRDRSRGLLRKVDKALERLKAGEYGLCESCDEQIMRKRLLARPEANLCIECKEEQEADEKHYMKRRLMREETERLSF